MWLLVFAIIALVAGSDLRVRGTELCHAQMYVNGAGQQAIVVGAWTSLVGGVCLDIAVWQLF